MPGALGDAADRERSGRRLSPRTAFDFGNGSVVMMARIAASLPLAAQFARRRRNATRRLLSMSSGTPMTPVDATSTWSARSPRPRPRRAAMCTRHGQAGLAGAGVGAAAVDDDGRGHAAGLRQVLARHDDRRRDGLVRREHRRGRRRARRRRSAPGRAAPTAAAGLRRLMPHATPAARKPAGRGHAAVDVLNHVSILAFVMRRRTGERRPAPRTSSTSRSDHHHRVLLAAAEQRAASTQSVEIFSGSHRCGTIEKSWRTKNRASCVNAHSISKPAPSRAGAARPTSRAARPTRRKSSDTTSERTSATRAGQRRQFGARLNFAVHFAHDEPAARAGGARRDRAAAVSFEGVRRNQRVQRVSVGVGARIVEPDLTSRAPPNRRDARRRASPAPRRCPVRSRCTAAAAGSRCRPCG